MGRILLLKKRSIRPPSNAFLWLPAPITPTIYTMPGLNLASYAPTGKKYYVSPSGNDGNDGLSAGSPKQDVQTTIAIGDCVELILASGLYDFGIGWDGGSPALGDRSLICESGKAILSMSLRGASWAAVDSHYTTASATEIVSVWDAADLDPDGDYTALTLVANEAAVDAAPGSWYWAANVLYVHTTDSREPDSDIRAMLTSTFNVRISNSNVATYFKNIEVHGGTTGIMQAGNNTQVYLDDCKVAYTASNGLWALNNSIVTNPLGRVYSSGTIAARCGKDGFSYTAYPQILEYNCISRANGGAAASNQCSTSHTSSTVIRVLGTYKDPGDQAVTDINTPSSWMVGCAISGATSNNGYAVQIDGDGWIESLTETNCTKSVAAVNVNSNIRLRLASLADPTLELSGGVISAY